MNPKTSQRKFVSISGGLSSLALVTLVLAQAAHGQDTSAAEAAAESGSIIYSRSVNHNVGDPYFPGRAQSIRTAPTATVLGALDVGLTPLSDLEASGVSASMAAPQTIVQHSLDIGTEPLSRTISSGINNEHSGSIVSGPISSGMASLGSALGSLSTALGSIQNLSGAAQ